MSNTPQGDIHKDAQNNIYKDFFRYILNGDISIIMHAFTGTPRIDTPLSGDISGEDAVQAVLLRKQVWLAARKAIIHHKSTTKSATRVVSEFVFSLVMGGQRTDLPVALVMDVQDEKLTAVRMYHSTLMLTGTPKLRAPLLAPSRTPDEPEVIGRYLEALGKSDVFSVLSLFHDDAYIRDATNAQPHEGKDALTRYYTHMLAGGGAPLKICTVTCDAQRVVLEYVCDEWANVPLSPQAGIVVFDLHTRRMFAAARFYDDITRPHQFNEQPEASYRAYLY